MLVDLLIDPRVSAIDGMTAFKAIESLVSTYDHVLKKKIDVRLLGHWRAGDYLNGRNLVPHRSINWFLEAAYKDSKVEGKISSGSLLAEGQTYSLKHGSRSPFVVFVVNDDLHHNRVGWTLGISAKFFCSVISIFRFQQYSEVLRRSLIRTLTLHETGHLLGLVDEKRQSAVEESIGRHCLNSNCVMRQGATVDHWKMMANQFMYNQFPYCELCQDELRNNIVTLSKSRSY